MAQRVVTQRLSHFREELDQFLHRTLPPSTTFDCLAGLVWETISYDSSRISSDDCKVGHILGYDRTGTYHRPQADARTSRGYDGPLTQPCIVTNLEFAGRNRILCHPAQVSVVEERMHRKPVQRVVSKKDPDAGCYGD